MTDQEKNEQLKNLQAMMGQTKEMAPQGQEKTITQGSGNKEVPAGKQTTPRKPREIKSQSKLFMEHNIGEAKNQFSVDSPVGKLMRVNSKLSEIAGFIVPNSPRYDINVTRTKVSGKDEDPRYETKINVKEKFSQQIKGVIVNFIPELEKRIDEERSARGTTPMTGTIEMIQPDGSVKEIARKTPEMFESEAATLVRSTKVLGYEAFIQWMLHYCWFAISEAPAIFWSHNERRTRTVDGTKTTEDKAIKSPADLRTSQSTGYVLTSKLDEINERLNKKIAENAGKFDSKGNPKKVKTPTLKDIYPLSSGYRGRKLAIPGNFIAIKKFETIAVKPSYTPEEQAEMNKMYIREGFSVNKQDTFMNKFNDMNAESKERVTITEAGDVTSSQFFAAQNSLVANEDYLKTIPRWWGKVDTTTVLDMRLVKKSEHKVEAKKDSKGVERPAYTKYVLDFTPFGQPLNDLTNAEYKSILAATDSRLTQGEVLDFIKTLNKSNTRDTNTRGGVNYDVTLADAQDIIAALDAKINAGLA